MLQGQRAAGVERGGEVLAVHDRRTQLADDDATGEVRKLGGEGHGCARRMGGRERGNHRVARAGNIEHLLRGGGEMADQSFSIDQCHAVLATGDQHILELVGDA